MKKTQQGSVLLLVIIVFTSLFALLGLSLDRGLNLFTRIQTHYLEDVALNLAEAGVEYTIDRLVLLEENFQGEENVMLDTGTFSTLVSRSADSDMLEILSTGTATGNRSIGDIVKTVRVLVQISPDDKNPIVYSWEELPQGT